jgi:magnesium-transporting ATPase (P-type)
MSINKIPHKIFKDTEINNTQDYSIDNAINSNNSDEKISIIEEFQLDIRKRKKSCCKSFFKCCFPCCTKVDTKSKRIVGFRDKYYNITHWSNKVENNKYNVILFFPTVLYNQFKQFGNFFYLVMAISQFIPDIKVGFLFAYVSPLCVVVIVSLLKELIDDVNRRIQDLKTNSTKVTTIQFIKN